MSDIEDRIEAALQKTGTVIFQALRDTDGVSQVSVTQSTYIEAKVIIDDVPVRVLVAYA